MNVSTGLPTNTERAERARIALAAYIAVAGDNGDILDNVTDLIADLLHLVEADGDDGQDDAWTAHARAADHYSEERDGI